MLNWSIYKAEKLPLKGAKRQITEKRSAVNKGSRNHDFDKTPVIKSQNYCSGFPTALISPGSVKMSPPASARQASPLPMARMGA